MTGNPEPEGGVDSMTIEEMLDQLEPLGLQTTSFQTLQPLRQLAGWQTEGKGAAVGEQPGSAPAHLLQGACFPAPGQSPFPGSNAASFRVAIRGIGHHPPGAACGEKAADLPQVPLPDLSGQSVSPEVVRGQGGGIRIQVHPQQFEPFRPGGQLEKEHPRAAAQVAHRLPPLHLGKFPQQQAVRPHREHAAPLFQQIGPQLFRRHLPPICRCSSAISS